MNKYTLRFLDPLLELKYQRETEFEKAPRLFSLVKIELLLSFVATIYTACTKKTLDQMVSVVAVILITIFIYLIRRFLPCILKPSLLLIFFCFTILFTESIADYKTSCGFSETSLALTIPLQLFTYSVLLTRFSWIFCSFYYIFGIVYLFLRITNLHDTNNKDIIILGLALSMLSFANMSYRQEQTFRSFYKSIHDSNQSLSHFKLLLQNIMPNPIFIVNYRKSSVEFLNKSASEMLSNKRIDMDHVLSTNIFKSGAKISERPSRDSSSSSDDLFTCYEKLLSYYKITETKEKIDASLAGTLSNYYNTNELQKIGTSGFLHEKEPIINFLTLNTVSESSFDSSGPRTSASTENCLYFDIKIAKIGWEKQPCLLVIFNDNTNLRKIIELQNLDEYKNRLLATVSHDLRTPLNGLLGILEVVTPQISEQEAKNSLIIAQRSGNLLLYMINDFLDFSQIMYKKIRLNLELVNIHEIIKETAELIEFQARKKNLVFLVNLNNVPIDMKIYTDGNRIKQILLNFLSNSLKFTQHGFIKLSVKIMNENPNITLKFSVKDSGIGIKESDKPKLFRLFSKLDQTDKEMNKTGVGLGLTISQSLVKLLDGSKERGIGLKSERGKGSKFWFFVSSKDDEEENVFSRPESLKIKLPFIKTYSGSNSTLNFFSSEKEIFMRNTGTPVNTHLFPFKGFSPKEKRILIVDDDLINLLIAQKYLEFYGLNYLTANNGEEAFEIVKTDILNKEFSITLILMDCNMPILDGFQASIKILNFLKNEGLPEMPIIAVTANVEVADQEKCYQAGMKKLLTKPVKRKDLGLVLQNYLKINLRDADPMFL